MAKVVIILEGGMIQCVMADSEEVKVMALDYDTEGGDPKRIKEFEGDQVYLLEGVDEMNPERVREIEEALFPA
jgi:hypothetical protein